MVAALIIARCSDISAGGATATANQQAAQALHAPSPAGQSGSRIATLAMAAQWASATAESIACADQPYVASCRMC